MRFRKEIIRLHTRLLKEGRYASAPRMAPTVRRGGRLDKDGDGIPDHENLRRDVYHTGQLDLDGDGRPELAARTHEKLRATAHRPEIPGPRSRPKMRPGF